MAGTKPGRGGGKLFTVEGLPRDVRDKLASDRLTNNVPAPAANVTTMPTPPAAHLKDWQRDIRDARLGILAEVRRLAEIGGSILGAEKRFARAASRGELAPHLARLVETANARKGKRRALSPATLRLWRRMLNQDGPDALAPKAGPQARPALPSWLAPLLDIYRLPSKPSLAWAVEQLAKEQPALDLPSLRTVERTVARLGELAVAPGRMLPREIKRLRAYTRRDFDMLLPTDVYTADGHTLDAEVMHPLHGRPFRPEIISILDVATRLCVGWSTGLAEGSWLVADAIRHAVGTCGIPAIYYVDNGCGFKNAFLEGPGLGVLCRLGTTWTHSLPYASQARGVIERFQRSCWVRAAKNLPSFMGADMDQEARQKVFKTTRKALAQAAPSALLLSWERFGAWAGQVVAEYNNRPHSSLPKITDRATGRKRHMTPAECWAAKADGAEIVKPTTAEAADLFRPYEIRLVRRALVSLGKREYFHADLELYHGKEVQVGYDIHDPSKVWVRDLDGRMICVAELDAHATPYFPKSMVEEAREKRAQGRIKRLEAHMAEARAELSGGAPAIEAQPAGHVIHLDPKRQERAAELARQAVNQAGSPRVAASLDTKERRLVRAQAIEADMVQGLAVDQADADWLTGYQTTPEYKAAQKFAALFAAKTAQ